MAALGLGAATSGGLTACGGGGGNTLTVITQDGPPIASAVTASIAPFKKRTGATVKLITAPFGDLYTKTMANFVSGGGSYDVILNPSSWLGDYSPHVVDLTNRIHKDKSLNWSDVIYQRNGQWGGRQIAMPVDGDNQLMYWRRDVIGDKGLSAAFKKEFGKPLAPPETWDDFMNIARFFGDGSHGIHGVAEAYRHGGQAFWYYMSNAAAWVTPPGEKGGLFFDPTTLKPLINDPGHVQGLKNYAEAVKYGPKGMINWDSNEVRQQFKNGATVLAIDWDDTPIIGELEKGTKVKGKISSALLPGTKRVWSNKNQQWMNLPSVSRPAWLAFGGWCGTIPKSSSNIDLAYKWLSFIASPQFSLKMVTGANSGMNPYRKSHFSDVEAWKKAGYPEPDLDMYLAAMKKSDLDPNAVQDLRMPGAAAFQDAVEVGTGRAVSGQTSPQAALDGIAAAWNKINERKGHQKQLAAYRASLNLGATG